jgi:hypothetical protein
LSRFDLPLTACVKPPPARAVKLHRSIFMEEKRMQTRIRVAVAALGVSLLAGCAPDAWQNVRADPFNDWLNALPQTCQPLWIGSRIVNRFPDDMQSQDGLYDQFLDLSSRLFYNRMSPADFRGAMLVTWQGERTQRSVDCMIASLPPDRPSRPSGNW